MDRKLIDRIVAEVEFPDCRQPDCREGLVSALAGEGSLRTAVLDAPLPDYRYLVLHPIGENFRGEAHIPAFVMTRSGERSLYDTRRIAQHFATTACGSEFDTQGHLALVRTNSVAIAAIDGDLGPKVGGNDSYDWYDLNDVPVGGSIWRISPLGSLFFFRRSALDQWEFIMDEHTAWCTTRQGFSVGDVIEGMRLVLG